MPIFIFSIRKLRPVMRRREGGNQPNNTSSSQVLCLHPHQQEECFFLATVCTVLQRKTADIRDLEKYTELKMTEWKTV